MAKGNNAMKRRKPKTTGEFIKDKDKDKEQKKERRITMTEIPETQEFEIKKKATEKSPEIKVRFPKKDSDRFQLPPDEFRQTQIALEALGEEKREVEVYSNSLENYLGYDSFTRILGKYFIRMVAYYRSEAGGSLSLEEARASVYRQNMTDDATLELFDRLLRIPTDEIRFYDLLEIHTKSPAMAQNLWEMIKNAAGREFETGHRAAEVFEPADYMKDVWGRASYLGLRESLIEEWQPKGGIELTMIDAIAQAWLQLQFWTKENVKRAQTEPRRENHQFYEWKQWNKQADPRQWIGGHWDIPFVSEQQAIEHAAQMADRWQRMYFRAIRSLRDWRRYTPNLTINNANQVNIATDGGKQVNFNNQEK